MSWVYALAPAVNLYFASYALNYETCTPMPETWRPSGEIFQLVWAALAVTTGVSAYNIAALNDLTSNNWFIALLFLLGPGYVVSNIMCNQLSTFVYVTLTFLVSLGLLLHLTKLAGTNSTEAEHKALLARNWLIPLQVWLGFAWLLTVIALGAKIQQAAKY